MKQFAPWLTFLSAAFLLAGCGAMSKSTSDMGTRAMGERVQVGPFAYTVTEARWHTDLGDGLSGKVPKNRFLLIKLSIANLGASQAGVPLFYVEDAKGESSPELTEGVDAVPGWLGIMRSMPPGHTESGAIVFDLPIGEYKLRVGDGGEPGEEKTALIRIPVHLE